MTNPTQLIQEACHRYTEGENTTSISRSLGFSGETIRRWLHESGIGIRSRSIRQTKYSHKKDYFQKGSATPTSAYFAGLLMADGNVISILETDSYLLERMKHELEYTSPIAYFSRKCRSGKWSKMAALRVTSKELMRDLSEWGVVPRKSRFGVVGPVVCPGSKLEEFFYRGLFDGDGCIHRRESGGLYINLGGTPGIVDSFRDWCWREIREAGSLNRRTETFHVVQFGGGSAAKVGRRLYRDPNAPRMTRKAKLLCGQSS